MNKDFDYYMSLDYEIKLKKLSDEEGGGWFAEIPLLPGCMSDGATVEECIASLDDAKRGWIDTCMELGRLVPEPVDEEFSGQLRLRMPTSLHKSLSERAKEEKTSLNQYIVYQLSRGIGYK